MEVLKHLLLQLRRTSSPSVVYHYAAPRALLGMVEHGQIWASDIRYLNDSQEYIYAASDVRGRLGELLLDPSLTPDYPCLHEMLQALDRAPQIQLFAASFSSRWDSLSQWRAYCPSTGGYAAGFRPGDVTEAAGCLLVPCVYDRNQQDVICEEVIGMVLNRFRGTVGSIEHKRNDAGAEFISAFFILACVLKDPGFSEEDEWRLITRSSFEGRTVPKFREGRSGIVPYVELPIRRTDRPLQLAEIVIGPNPHPELALEAVVALLQANDVVCGVRRSGIPYRAW